MFGFFCCYFLKNQTGKLSEDTVFSSTQFLPTEATCFSHTQYKITYLLQFSPQTPLACLIPPSGMWMRDLCSLCPLKAQVHSHLLFDFPFFSFLLDSPGTFFPFWKSQFPHVTSFVLSFRVRVWGALLSYFLPQIYPCPPKTLVPHLTFTPIQFLLPIKVTYSCPASFFSHLQDYISPSFNKCSKFHSCESSLHSCVTDLVPCQRDHFIPWLSSGCCHLLGSFLNSHVGERATFVTTDSPHPIWYLIFLLGWKQQNPWRYQHFTVVSTFFWDAEDKQDKEEVGQPGTVLLSSFQFLSKLPGSYSLLPQSTHSNRQKILDCIVGPQSLTTKQNVAANNSLSLLVKELI